MADYPTKKLNEQNIPKGRGHVGEQIDSGIEGRGPEKDSIRSNSKKQGNKSAGDISGTNVNSA